MDISFINKKAKYLSKGDLIMMTKKAQAGRIVGFVVYLILVLGVGIPISQDVITTANLSGISATVVSFIPVMLAVGGMVAAVATSGLRT